MSGFADGTQVRVVSDETWKGRHGPIRSGDLLGGEHYDARLALPGWAEADYDDAGWELAWPDPGPVGQIVPTPCEPVEVVGEVHPQSEHRWLPGSRTVGRGAQGGRDRAQAPPRRTPHGTLAHERALRSGGGDRGGEHQSASRRRAERKRDVLDSGRVHFDPVAAHFIFLFASVPVRF